MFGRPKNRRRQNAGGGLRRLRLPAVDWRRWSLSALSLGAVLGTAALVVRALDQPIETIAVTGRFQRVSPLEVERTVKELVRGAGLVSVDLEAVRAAVDRLPWVDTVSVQRAWPHGLELAITEQVAAARWGDSGLLNTRGELFVSEARHVPPELPRLSGPPGTENAVAQRYFAMQGRLIEAGMRLTALRLDARGAWDFDLDNGVTVRLGRRDVDARFETFMAAAARLVSQRSTDIAYVDMRYTNGFAIGWRSGPARRSDEDETRDA